MKRRGFGVASALRWSLLPLLAAAWLFGGAVPARAVPAAPAATEVRQPDGRKITIHLRGDEFFSWHEDERGYVIKRDVRDGFWKYAVPKPDAAGFDAIEDAEVGVADPAALKLKPHDLPRPEVLREHRRRTRPEGSVPGARTAPASDAGGTAAPPAEPAPPRVPVSGTTTVKNIVILAAFSDHWSGGTVMSSKGRTNTTEYTNLFNQIGHTADGAVGSVKDYYKEVSYNKLTVDTVVTGWVQLPNNEAFYGAGNPDANPRQMVADAISAADTAGFDFSQGDSDGDSWVDSLTIIHSGHGEEVAGNPSNCIWSHQWAMSSTVTVDGVKMRSYHTEPALRGTTASTSIVRIGVISHEMGHFFGLPDLYDYSNTTYGVGDWGLMAGGSWNGSDGKSPAHFCAWSKYKLGFATPAIIHAKGSLSLPRVEDNASVHMYVDGTGNAEYFLVENRAKLGFDNASEIYPGIVIYHVDGKSANNDLGTWAHPAVKIEEGDGDNSLGAKTAGSEAGDVWTSTNGLAGGFRDQTGDQDSNAMLYQLGHAYNRSDNSAYYSYLRLSNFSAAGATMTYDVTTLKPTVADGSSGTGDYTVAWGACTNATKYEIQEGSAVTLTSFSDGAESETATYGDWALLGDARRTNGGARTGSYSYMMQYYDSGTGRFYSSVQGMTMRDPFTVKSSTAITFYYKSKFATGSGYLKAQVSKDGGSTWLTLGTLSGYQDSWTLVTYNYASLNALGVNVDDQCIVRFIADFEEGLGWSTWPSYGYAIDDFQIANMEMASYGNWSTLDNNVGTNSYYVSGKGNGTYAYQVQAYANGAWQGYSSVGAVTVVPTLSEWGIIAMSLVMFGGVLVLRRRRAERA
jgi:M6 family metalloprotease-like protein